MFKKPKRTVATVWMLSSFDMACATFQVRGHLEQNGQRLAAPTIHGRWDKAVHASMPDGSDRLLFSVHEVAEKRCVWDAASLAMIAERWVGVKFCLFVGIVWLDRPLLLSTRGQSRGAVSTDGATAASRPSVEQTAASFFGGVPV